MRWDLYHAAPPRSPGPTLGRPLQTYGRVSGPASQDLRNPLPHPASSLGSPLFHAGPNRVLLPTLQREFRVLLQVGEPDPEGKVEINITGRHWYPKRAKKMIQSLAGKSRRKRYGGKELDVPGGGCCRVGCAKGSFIPPLPPPTHKMGTSSEDIPRC